MMYHLLVLRRQKTYDTRLLAIYHYLFAASGEH
jgi:hypothetical protein